MTIDWGSVFLPSVSPLEILVRGSAMYLGVLVLLRIVLRRQAGTLAMTDLLLITLLADASQNAMAGAYKSLPDGLLLVATIVLWNYALDWLGYRSVLFRRLIEPPPVPLIKNGTMLRRNMRKELITEEELRGQLREHGIEDIAMVKEACIETDGHISVIERKTKRGATGRHDGPVQKGPGR